MDILKIFQLFIVSIMFFLLSYVLGVTAKYGKNADGTISVHNYATLKAPTGEVTTIDGYAYYPGC